MNESESVARSSTDAAPPSVALVIGVPYPVVHCAEGNITDTAMCNLYEFRYLGLMH